MSKSLASATMRTYVKVHRDDLAGLRTDLDRLRAGTANLRIDANSLETPEQKHELLQLVREAMRDVDLSQKAFALTAKQSESVISEALSGGRHLAADWIYAQSDAYLAALLRRIERARQLTPETKAALRAQRIAELIGLLLEVA